MQQLTHQSASSVFFGGGELSSLDLSRDNIFSEKKNLFEEDF